jgi:hypothetical protein
MAKRVSDKAKRLAKAKRNKAICNAYAKGTSQADLAVKYGISAPRISQIVRAGQTAVTTPIVGAGQTASSNPVESMLYNLLMQAGIDVEKLLCDGVVEGKWESVSFPKKPKTKAKAKAKAKSADYVDCPPKSEWTPAMKKANNEAYKSARDKGLPYIACCKAGYQAVADMVS